MAIADHYDGFLIDLDGVVWLGHEMLPGSTGALNALLSAGKPLAFVTNSPRLSPAEQAGILRGAGVGIDDARVVTAGSTLIALARERLGSGSSLLATGTASFREQVAEAGFDLLGTDQWRDAEAVLVSGHPGFDYDELRAAAMAARAGALLAATGRDPTMPMPDGLWPGTGSILAAIETASGAEAVTTGKPAAAIFRSGLAAIGLENAAEADRSEGAPRVAMIGDRLDSDIAGAKAIGLDGILVEGNASGGDPGADGSAPDHRVSSLAGVVS